MNALDSISYPIQDGKHLVFSVLPSAPADTYILDIYFVKPEGEGYKRIQDLDIKIILYGPKGFPIPYFCPMTYEATQLICSSIENERAYFIQIEKRFIIKFRSFNK